jgi:hypothetical protein
MKEDYWNLVAKYVSDNSTQEQEEELCNWLEIKKEDWSILADATLIWNSTKAQTIPFDSQKAWRQLKAK